MTTNSPPSWDELTLATEAQSTDVSLALQGSELVRMPRSLWGDGGGGGTITIVTPTIDVEAVEVVGAGQPVVVGNDGKARLAVADDILRAGVAAIAKTAATIGFTTQIGGSGLVTLADWSAATGAATLAVGATYWLGSGTAGRLTTIAPTATDTVCVRVGRAVAADTLDVNLFSIQL